MKTKQCATKQPIGQQRKESKVPWDKWKWKHNCPKSMGHSKSSCKRKVDSDTGLHQETWKSQINNLLTLHVKKLGKEEQPKPRVRRRKKIIKMRAEINEIETKRKQQKRSILRAGSLKR